MHTILYFLFNLTLPCIWWKFSEIVMYKREYTNCPNFGYFIFPKSSRQGYLEVIAGPFHFGDFQLCQIPVFLFSSKMKLLVWIQYDWFLTHSVRYWNSYRAFFFFFNVLSHKYTSRRKLERDAFHHCVCLDSIQMQNSEIASQGGQDNENTVLSWLFYGDSTSVRITHPWVMHNMFWNSLTPSRLATLNHVYVFSIF